MITLYTHHLCKILGSSWINNVCWRYFYFWLLWRYQAPCNRYMRRWVGTFVYTSDGQITTHHLIDIAPQKDCLLGYKWIILQSSVKCKLYNTLLVTNASSYKEKTPLPFLNNDTLKCDRILYSPYWSWQHYTHITNVQPISDSVLLDTQCPCGFRDSASALQQQAEQTGSSIRSLSIWINNSLTYYFVVIHMYILLLL